MIVLIIFLCVVNMLRVGALRVCQCCNPDLKGPPAIGWQRTRLPVSTHTNSGMHTVTNVAQQIMLSTIRLYKHQVSPLLPPNCRFVPSCSIYGAEAIEKFGPWRGGLLTSWRILRCNPTGGSGYDPPIWPPPHYLTGSASGRK